MELLIKVFKIVCWIPYFYIILFYSYVLRASISLGHVPSYNNPDPSVLDFVYHHKLISITFDISFYGSLLGSIILLLLLILRKIKTLRTSLVIFLVGVIIILFNLFIDPFFEWYVD